MIKIRCPGCESILCHGEKDNQVFDVKLRHRKATHSHIRFYLHNQFILNCGCGYNGMYTLIQDKWHVIGNGKYEQN